MLGTIIKKEITSHVLSLRFGVTFILFLVLVFASIYVTVHQYRRDKAEQYAAQRRTADAVEEIMKEAEADKRIRKFWRGGLSHAVPVSDNSWLVQGLTPQLPLSVAVSRDRPVARGSSHNPLADLLPLPDLLYVVSVVLSLLAILFAFDSICGEKEAGTLRLMLANSVPRHAVLLGKWIGGYLVLIVPFLLASAGAIAYARWQGVMQFDNDTLARLGALVVVACLYISVFFTLSLFISSVTQRAATSLFLCLLIWVVWILVIPNLAPVIGKIVSPAPAASKISAETSAISKEVDLRINRLTLTSGELSYGQKVQQEKDRIIADGNREMRRLDRFYEDSLGSQQRIAETLGRISPSGCWTYAAVAICDTGPDAYKLFEDGQKRMEQQLNDLNTYFRNYWMKNRKDALLEESQIPRLDVKTQPLADSFKVAVNDVLLLAVLNVVFFLGAFLFFLRYDVR